MQAAFSLDLVDKAVLSLQPRTPNAINEEFYRQRGLGVMTYSGMAISVNRLVEEEREDLEALGVGGGGGEGEEAPPAAPEPTAVAEAPADGAEKERSAASELPPGVELREEFEDTAF